MAKRSINARDENGKWDIGGGGLEFGYTIEDTLRKEIREEYCAEAISYEYLGYREVHRLHHKRKTHWIALDFKVLVDREAVRIGEPHKFDEIGWFSLDNCPENVHSQLPEFFRLYKRRLF